MMCVQKSTQRTMKTTYIYKDLSLLSLTQTGLRTIQSLTYLYGSGSTPVGASYRSSPSATPLSFEIVSDMRGDVRELRDLSGVAFARYDYDAYGNITSSQTFATALISLVQAQAISEIQPLRYAGYVFDSETRLYYCSQRYYDPSVGAFISKDPAKAGGEKSAYGYCGGEPINWVDPSGLSKLASWEFEAQMLEIQESQLKALSSKPTFNGKKTGHVWENAPSLYYKCSCCRKVYTCYGTEAKMLDIGALVLNTGLGVPPISSMSILQGKSSFNVEPAILHPHKKTEAPLDMGQYRDKNGNVYYDWDRYFYEQDKIMRDAQMMSTFGFGPLLNGMAYEANRCAGDMGYPIVAPNSLPTPNMPYFDDRYTYKDPLDKLFDRIFGP